MSRSDANANICFQCGHDNPPQARFCAACGVELGATEVPGESRPYTAWRLWLLWTLATALAWACANALSYYAFERVFGGYSAFPWLVLGPTVGVAQWLVLRRYLADPGWWILASAVGYSFLVLGAGVPLLGAFGGAVVGLGQWLILRRHVPVAGLWVAASALGFAVGTTLEQSLFWGLRGGGAVTFAILGAVGGAAVGAITGAAMVWLLRQPVILPASGDDQSPRAFRTAFLWTAVPIVALGIISTFGAVGETQGEWYEPNPLYLVWYGAAGLALIAVLGTIGFAIARKGRTASGILAGIGVGVLALALTCFANLSTLE